MQQRVLHSGENPILQPAKEKRILRPSRAFHEGRRIYANELGQQFFSRSFPTAGRDGKHHTIEVLQLGEGKPLIRYSATTFLMGKALKIEYAERVKWGFLPKLPGPQPSGYRAMRLILSEAISLAESLGAQTIYAEPVNFKVASYYLSLGFREIPNSGYMGLPVPVLPSKP